MGLLPPLTFATDDLVVTAILEPCYDVGGDIFDYALNDDVLSVGLFDTCGHGIKASTLASLVVSAYRNARRCGLDLVDTAISIDRWVRSEHPNFFATALLIELDRRTGRLSIINAGHPGAMLLRDGKAIRELPADRAAARPGPPVFRQTAGARRGSAPGRPHPRLHRRHHRCAQRGG
ncbi:SpoIIE family protein phosphatase [Micromonospora sp. M12]